MWNYLRGGGHVVVYTHKDQGIDFLKYHKDDVKDFDYIISNPPFSIKNDVLKHLYHLGKPFMVLLPLNALETRTRTDMFKKYGLDLIVFDKRVNFIANKGNWFSSAYFTWKVFGENKIIFERLDNNERL